MPLKLITSLILSFFFILFSYSQTVNWVDVNKQNYLRNELEYSSKNVFVNNDSFFNLQYVSNLARDKGDVKIARYEGTFLKSSTVTDIDLPGKPTFLNAIASNDNLLLFFYTNQLGDRKLYYQIYDQNCMKIGEPNLVLQYKLHTGWSSDFTFEVLESQNKNFFSVFYMLPENRDESSNRFLTYGLKVLDHNFETIKECKYESPFTTRNSRISNSYLTNNGEYCLGIKVSNDADLETRKEKTKSIRHIVLVTENNSFNSYELSLGNQEISKFYFTSDDGFSVNLFGIYSESEGQICGTFCSRLNLKSKSFVNTIHEAYTYEFMTKDMSKKDLSLFDKSIKQNSIVYELAKFSLKQTFVLSDKSIMVVLEDSDFHFNSYDFQSPTPDNSILLGTRTGGETVFYFNDLLVLKFSPDGELIWKQRIKKKKFDSLKESNYCAVYCFIQGDVFTILFNDNQSNFLSNGTYNYNENPSRPFSKAFLSRYDFNIITGEINHSGINLTHYDLFYLYPRLFHYNSDNKELFIYGKFKYDKCGKLKI